MAEKKQEDGGWETIDAGGFIEFKEAGVEHIGLVMGHKKKTTSKGEANEWTLMTKDGVKTFFSPQDLHTKLAGLAIKHGVGNFIAKITFKEKVKTAGGNDFNVFEVAGRLKDDETLKSLGINPDAVEDDTF